MIISKKIAFHIGEEDFLGGIDTHIVEDDALEGTRV
jgi:hypothetical protein